MAGTIFAGTTYYVAIRSATPQTFSVSDAQRMHQFSRLATIYDSKTKFQEIWLGISRRRRSLLRQYAKGQVLEVGAGTGRNIGLFPENVTSVVMCDQSPEMVAVMEANYNQLAPPVHKEIPYEFQCADAEKLPFADNQFDTVIDVFGLCSYAHPLQALTEMNRVCKPGGALLLLEHGKGNRSWLNEYLQKFAPGHALRWGCWWNREIGRLVRLSGLSADILAEQYHFGTTHVMVCSPTNKQEA